MDNQFISIFCLSMFSGLILRKSYDGDMPAKTVNKMAWTLLLILVVETFSAKPPNLLYLLVGLFFLLFVTALSNFFNLFVRGDSDSSYIAIASSTFGGGNRGYALIAVIGSWDIFSKDQSESMVSSFLQIDAMVLMWLMTVVPILISRKVGSDSVSFVDSIKSSLSSLGFSPLIVVFFVMMSWAIPDTLMDSISYLLTPSHSARSFLLLYLSLTYVFLMTNLTNMNIGVLSKYLFLFYVPRCVVAALSILLLYILTKSGVGPSFEQYSLIIPLGVLALCPPSSGLNNFMEQFNVPENSIATISSLNIVTTLIFAVALLMVAALSSHSILIGIK